jgi:prepilin-type N-terminal cleavage/methylation domain-containing protein
MNTRELLIAMAIIGIISALFFVAIAELMR